MLDDTELPAAPRPKPFVPFFGDDGEKCGHLFAAIITQAFHDVFAPQSFNDGGKDVIRRDAIAFMTARSGEWRAHRNWLCTCVGIDGDALAESVRDMLSGNTSPRVKETRLAGAQYVLAFKPKQVDSARAMYREMNDRPPAPRPVRTTKLVAPPKPEHTGARPLDIPDDASDVLKEWFANMSAA